MLCVFGMKGVLKWILAGHLCTFAFLNGAAVERGAIISIFNPAPIGFLDENNNFVLAPLDETIAQVLVRPPGSSQPFQVLPNQHGKTQFELNLATGFFHYVASVRIPVEPATKAEFIVRAWKGAPTWVEATMSQSSMIGQTPPFDNEVGVWDISEFANHRLEKLDRMPHVIISGLDTQDRIHEWMTTYFSDEQLEDSSIGGLEADADKDGLSNLMEFFYGTNPKISADGTNQIRVAEIQIADEIEVLFRKRIDTRTLQWSLITSSNLLEWSETAGDVKISALANGDGHDTIQIRIPMEQAVKFYKLKVDMNR